MLPGGVWHADCTLVESNWSGRLGVMHRRCAWCGWFLGVVDDAEGRGVTFSICDPCSVRVIAESDPISHSPTRTKIRTWLAPTSSETGDDFDGHYERSRGHS